MNNVQLKNIIDNNNLTINKLSETSSSSLASSTSKNKQKFQKIQEQQIDNHQQQDDELSCSLNNSQQQYLSPKNFNIDYLSLSSESTINLSLKDTEINKNKYIKSIYNNDSFNQNNNIKNSPIKDENLSQRYRKKIL